MIREIVFHPEFTSRLGLKPSGPIRDLGPIVILTGANGAGKTRHLALVADDGTPLLLRERSGEFIRSIVAGSSGFDDDPQDLASRPYASCSADSCIAVVERGGRRWQFLATRSSQSIEWRTLVGACAKADIVVSDRWARGCTPALA